MNLLYWRLVFPRRRASVVTEVRERKGCLAVNLLTHYLFCKVTRSLSVAPRDAFSLSDPEGLI